MGILNRLWTKVWQSDRNRLEMVAQAHLANGYQKLQQEAEEIRASMTPVKEECMKMGGPEGEEPDYSQYSGSSSSSYRQAIMLQQMQMAQAQQNLVLQNLGVQNQTATSGSAGLYSSGTAAPSSSNVYLGGAVPAVGTAIYNPNTMTQAVYTGSVIGGTRWPTLGSGDRDTFFMALKGIEEASMKNPEGNHKYDDDALAIQDMRYFDATKVSLMGVISFCLSNVIDPNGIIILLEGHGMKLEIE